MLRMRTVRTAQDAVAADVVSRIVALFDLRECRFEAFPFDVQLPRLEPGRVVLPAAEPGIGCWQGGAVELPVRTADGLTLGRFVLVPRTATCGVAWSPQARATAIACAQAAASSI